MKMVFICSPYRGNIDANLKRARKHARFATMCGYCPVVPHLLFPQFLNDSDPDERIKGITLGVAQMEMCDEVWIFGPMVSNGMAYELEAAKKLRIPVRMYDNDDNRIYPATMMIDDRISDEYRHAIRDLQFA